MARACCHLLCRVWSIQLCAKPRAAPCSGCVWLCARACPACSSCSGFSGSASWQRSDFPSLLCRHRCPLASWLYTGHSAGPHKTESPSLAQRTGPHVLAHELTPLTYGQGGGAQCREQPGPAQGKWRSHGCESSAGTICPPLTTPPLCPAHRPHHALCHLLSSLVWRLDCPLGLSSLRLLSTSPTGSDRPGLGAPQRVSKSGGTLQAPEQPCLGQRPFPRDTSSACTARPRAGGGPCSEPSSRQGQPRTAGVGWGGAVLISGPLRYLNLGAPGHTVTTSSQGALWVSIGPD